MTSTSCVSASPILSAFVCPFAVSAFPSIYPARSNCPITSGTPPAR
jgi:hypothetical protein